MLVLVPMYDTAMDIDGTKVKVGTRQPWYFKYEKGTEIAFLYFHMLMDAHGLISDLEDSAQIFVL